jgi:hypothetical protein
MRRCVVTAALALAAAGCGATAAAPPHQNGPLAFARCMRAHGVASFPDPDPNGNLPSVRPSAAATACKHLLGGGDRGQTPGDRTKLVFALQVARCMRRHGYPGYPDPSGPSAASQGSGTRFSDTGIDVKSPRFQRAEAACELKVRKALGIPRG